MLVGDLPGDWESSIPQFAPDDGPMATRKASGKILTAVAEHLWNLVGGSADLNPSTNTALAGRGDFQRPLVSHSSAEMEPASQGVNLFGASAPGKDVLFQYGFTVENVVTRALTLVVTRH